MVKHLLTLLILLTTFVNYGKAQTTPPDTADYPYWIDMMTDPSVNFYKTQRAFEIYWQNRPITKGNGYKPFKRWEYNMLEIIDGKGNIPTPGSLAAEVERYMAIRKAAIGGGGNIPGLPGSSPCLTSGNWTELGPYTMPTNKTGQPNGLGRINSLAFHPTDSNLLYAGSPAGGFWISTNGGQNWSTTTDTLVTLGVSSIAIDPQKPDTIYIGTGDRDASDSYGRGVLKSIDGGVTWTSANSGMGNVVVGRLIIDPTNTQILIAASSSGLYRSTNGASSWTRLVTDNFREVVFNPSNSNYVYATTYSTAEMYRSGNNGVTWSKVTPGLPTGKRRMVIGVSPADSLVVYNLVTNQRTFAGLYISHDRGLTFSLMSDSPNIMDYSHLGTGTSGQAWYNLDIAVDPKDASIIYSAGVNIFQSTDSGKTWKISAHWVGSGGAADVHADNHVLEFQPNTNTLFAGNDGGIYYTKDRGANWPEISNGLGIAQIYRLGQSALSPDLLINGYQDNGTGLYNNGTWFTIMGGDGMDCVIDPSDDTWAFSDLYYGDIRRYKNNVNNGTVGKNGVNGINESGGWVTPFILEEGNTSTMFAGYKNVWRSTNIKASSASSVSWTKISTGLGGVNNQNITVLENSSVDNNLLYVARADRKLFKTSDANAATPTWTDLTSSLPNNAAIQWIETHRSFKNRLWICQSNKVYQSDNGGTSWTNISSGLPNIPILCVTFDSSSAYQGLYAGTYMGVFYKDTAMSAWIWYNDKMPINTRVRDIEIYYSPSGRSKSHVVCATYGRGNWRSPLYDEDQIAPVAGFKIEKKSICQNQSQTFTDTTSNLPTRWLWEITPNTVSYISGTDSCSQNPVVQFNAKGTYSVKFWAANCKGIDSVEKTLLIDVYDPITVASCTGHTTNVGGFGIGVYGVDVGALSHTSQGPNVEGGYVNRACTEIVQLKTDTAYFTTITTGKSYDEYVKVFIDFNDNGDLNDAGEMVFDGPRGRTTHQDSIRIPKSPVTNTLLRMRVMSDFDTIPANACDTLRYGQMEDFGVVIESRVPEAIFGIDTNRICQNQRITLTDSSTGTIFNQRWYVSKYDLLTYKSDSAGPIQFILPDTGWYYAQLVLNDSTVSKRIDSIVYVKPVPTGSLGITKGNLSSCEGADLELTNNASPAGSVTSKWFKQGAEMSGETASTLSFSNMTLSDTGTYYSEVDWGGCGVTTSAAIVNVSPAPKAGFTENSTEQCFINNRFNFTNTSTISSGSPNYTWTFGDGGTSSDSSPTYSYSSFGSYDVKLVSRLGTCSDSLTKSISVWESAAIGFNFNSSTQCLDKNSFIFTNTSTISSGSLTNNWDLGDGSSGGTFNYTYSYATADTFDVQLIVTTGNNCKDTLVRTVIVHPSPISDFTTTTYSTCANSNLFDFINSSTITKGSIIGEEWIFSDGTGSSSKDVMSKTFSGNGTYEIKLVSVSDLGCTDTTLKSVVVVDDPISDFTISNASQCLNGNIVTLTNSSSVNAGSIVSSNWDFGDGTTSTSTDPSSHSYASDGMFSVQLIVISDRGCSDTTTQNVEIFPMPIVDFVSAEGCVGEVISFINNSSISSGTLNTFEWSFGDGDVAFLADPSHSYANPGIYEVKLIVTSDQGCVDSIINKTGANIFDNPNADFEFSKVGSSGIETLIQFTDLSTNAITWLWDFGIHGSSADQNPLITFSDSGTYQIRLWVTNSDGCADSISKSVFVFPDNSLQMPLSFSPNGDGLNEVFKPYGLGYLQTYKMEIFNRWGEKLFETTDPQLGWDGTYQGSLVEPTAYIVIIEYIDLNNERGHVESMIRVIR